MKRLAFLILVLFISACATAPKEPVSYTTPPASDEEKAVADAVKTMVDAYNNQDIEKHILCYAPEARIDSKLAGGFVTRDEYRKILLKSGRLTTIRLKDVKISEVSAEKYRVDAILSLSRGNFPIYYDFVPIDGKWLVIEQSYK
jgi:hypothetical protein